MMILAPDAGYWPAVQANSERLNTTRSCGLPVSREAQKSRVGLVIDCQPVMAFTDSALGRLYSVTTPGQQVELGNVLAWCKIVQPGQEYAWPPAEAPGGAGLRPACMRVMDRTVSANLKNQKGPLTRPLRLIQVVHEYVFPLT
jgi:hypothetical protein